MFSGESNVLRFRVKKKKIAYAFILPRIKYHKFGTSFYTSISLVKNSKQYHHETRRIFHTPIAALNKGLPPINKFIEMTGQIFIFNQKSAFIFFYLIEIDLFHSNVIKISFVLLNVRKNHLHLRSL